MGRFSRWYAMAGLLLVLSLPVPVFCLEAGHDVVTNDLRSQGKTFHNGRTFKGIVRHPIKSLLVTQYCQQPQGGGFTWAYFGFVLAVLLLGLATLAIVRFAYILKKLRVKAARWSSALEGAGDVMWEINLQTGDVVLSRRWIDLAGYAPHEPGDKLVEFEKLMHPQDKPAALKHFETYLGGNVEHLAAEYRLRCKDGSWKWVLTRGVIIDRDAQNRPLRLVGTHSDITPRKEAQTGLLELTEELELRVQERTDELTRVLNRLKRAQAIAQVGEWSRDLQTNQERWSDEVYRINGCVNSAASFEAFQKAVHPDDLDCVLLAQQEAISKGKPGNIAYRTLHPNGTMRYVTSQFEYLPEAAGGASQLVGVSQDITAIKSLESALQVNEARLRTAQRIAGIGSWEWNLLSDEHIWSEQTYRIMGLSLATHRPSHEAFKALLHPDDVPMIEAAEKRGAADNVPFSFECRVIRHDGSVINILFHVEIIKDANGKPVRLLGTLQDVTESKQAEQALQLALKETQESEQRFRSLTNLSSDWYWECDAKLRFTMISQGFQRVTGIDPATLLGLRIDQIDFVEVGTEEWEKFNAKFSAKEAFYELEWQLRRVNGEVCYGVTNGEPLFDRDHGFIGYRGIGRDITVTKQAEAAQNRETRLRKLVEHLPAGAVYIEDGILLLNQAAEKITGYRRDEIVDMAEWFNKVHRHNHAAQWLLYQQDRDADFPAPREIDILTKTGLSRNLQFAGYCDDYSEVWLLHDVTSRKEAEAALKQALLEQQVIFDNSEIGILFVRDKLIHRVNKGFEHIIGYSSEELCGGPARIFHSSEQAYQALGAALYPVVESGAVFSGDTELTRKDGVNIWCSLRSKAIDPNNPGHGIVTVLMDITAARNSAATLVEAKRRVEVSLLEIEQQKDRVELAHRNISVLSEIGREITATLDRETIMMIVYRHVHQLMEADVFGIDIHHDGQDTVDCAFSMARGQRCLPYRRDIHDPNQLAIWCLNNRAEVFINDSETECSNYIDASGLATLNPLKLADGPVSGVPLSLIYVPMVAKDHAIGMIGVWSFRKNAYQQVHLDMLVTLAAYTAVALDNADAYRQLQSAQQQLVFQEKMAALGTLTAGVAHEINNPANFAHVGAQGMNMELERFRTFLLELAGEDADASIVDTISKRIDALLDLMRNVIEGTTRIKNIVLDLRSFSRLDQAEMKAVAIADSLLSTVNLVRTKYAAEMVEIRCDLDANPILECFPAELNQVFMNLIVNACQAIQGKQRQTNDPTPGVLAIRSRIDGLRLVLEFGDNGGGIPRDSIDHIFDPFFTTKTVGEGTGLGLSISFGIIKKHHGSISVDSVEGEGTCFTISLPLRREIS